MSETVLEIKNVSKSFGKKRVLKNIDFSLKEGTIVGLLGKNGSGKSTTIKLINDLLTPDEGEIRICGEKIGVESKRNVAFLPESDSLQNESKVIEILNFYNDFYDNFDLEKAREMLKDFDIDENDRVGKLSKGMKEKVCLTCVMSRNAKLYILDEPLGGVDPASRDYILDTILNNFNNKGTMIISTHLISDIERILDEVIFIDGGKIVLHENADKLRQEENASVDEVFRRKFYVKKAN